MDTMNLFSLFKRRDAAPSTASRRPPRAVAKTGQAARSPLSTHDATLSFAAQEWQRALPANLRPQQLCAVYPRVANRLALCWNDLSLVDSVFNELLLDRRGGRAGFPASIAAELMRLHALHERRVIAAGWGRPTNVAR